MKFISKLAAAATAGAAAAVLSALPASAATADAWPGQANAVFVQTDNAAGNTIVAYTRTAGGGQLPDRGERGSNDGLRRRPSIVGRLAGL
jgi:hypothetical protein